ncbi:MAG: hypothetical protein B6244_11635 [Candidatus Cloacimonetes bacterium 4572_55]|nr:MAG: hypothetical protein B6244_11635 [Candidatus Cloacimonetes bacterium 4572_55]
MRRIMLLCVLFIFLTVQFVSGDVPYTISYQGILKDSAGDPVSNATYSLTFTLYNAETGGTALWTETHATVQTQNGVFDVILGSVTALTLSFDDPYWLGIAVNTGSELSPRIELTSSAYSFNVRDNAITNSKLADDAVTSAEILDGEVNTADLADDSVTSAKILDGDVGTANLADDAVTSAKVLNNSLQTADIFPDIVSSIDSVVNDGGNIDLVAGQNVTITPDDVNNKITISAVATNYSEGRCIEIDDNEINNIMQIVGDQCVAANFDPLTCTYNLETLLGIHSGDNCIGVSYNDDICEYEITNEMDIDGGLCVDVSYDDDLCIWDITLDLDCLADEIWVRIVEDIAIMIHDSLSTFTVSVDSIFYSEIYVQSVVIGTPETVNPPHWESDGTIRLPNSDGGETTLDHTGMRSDDGAGNVTEVGPGGQTSVDDQGNETSIDAGGLSSRNADDNGHDLNSDGTWQAYRDGQVVAGLDEDGEIFAKSFYVTPDGTFENATLHLTTEGDIELTGDGEILRDGELYFSGGEQDSVFDSEIFVKSVVIGEPDPEYPGGVSPNSPHWQDNGNIHLPSSNGGATDVNGERVRTDDGAGNVTEVEPEGVTTGDGNGNSVSVNSGGTWTATQDDLIVSGLDENGEIFAKSFYVKDPVTGDTLLHVTNTGQIFDANGDPYSVGSEQDSVFNSEVYARSFVVTEDGTMDSATSHMKSDGSFETYGQTSTTRVDGDGARIVDMEDGSSTGFGSNGFSTYNSSQNGHSINKDGTWTAFQNNGIATAGLDSNGEFFAESFYVKDPVSGDTLGHWDGSGNLLLPGLEGQTTILPGEIHIDNFGVDSFFDVFTELDLGIGLQLGNSQQDLFKLNNNSTWTATRGGLLVAGLDGNGEIFAESFFLRNPSTGDTLGHWNDSGNLLLPGLEGQTTILPGEIHIDDFGIDSFFDVFIELDLGIGLQLGNSQEDLFKLNNNSTWTATRGGLLVAGLDGNGEIFAESFFVRNPSTGDTLLHLTDQGDILDSNGDPYFTPADVDSIFDSEVYARSFVVTTDGTPNGTTNAHVTSSGEYEGKGLNLELLTGTARIRTITDTITDMELPTLRIQGESGHTDITPSIRYTYDNMGRLTSADDTNGNIQRYEYDGMNRIIRQSGFSPHRLELKEFPNPDEPNSFTGVTIDGLGKWHTWQQVDSEPTEVAGLDGDGEMYARSFMVINPSDGTTVSHLTNLGGLNLSNELVMQAPDDDNDVPIHWFDGLDVGVGKGIMIDGDLQVQGFIQAENVNRSTSERLLTDPVEIYAPGTVLIIDPDSDKFIPCNAADQSSVIGIVAPGAARNDDGTIQTITYGASTFVDGNEVEIRVKADATYGKIRRGDLLTTSPTVGYAMKAENPRIGAIIGKALDNLDNGRDEIRILVTLN